VLGAQPDFLQARTLRQPECEPGIVAERAEVAEVIGDALAFQGERAQPLRTRRHDGSRDALECLAVRPREGNGRIARDACCQAMAIGEPHLREALLDSLVHVATSGT